MPTDSTLQNNVKKVRAETMEAINRTLVGYAKGKGVGTDTVDETSRGGQ